MNVFMKIVLIVAVVAILTGVVGGIITAGNHRDAIESGEYDRGERMEEYKNGMSEGEGCGMMDKGGMRGQGGMTGGRGQGRPDADSAPATE